MFIIINKNKLIYRFLPILVLITGMAIWGIFGYNKTGRVPFLNSMSSTNQDGLALVFNDKFKNIYPKKIIAIIGAVKTECFLIIIIKLHLRFI